MSLAPNLCLSCSTAIGDRHQCDGTDLMGRTCDCGCNPMNPLNLLLNSGHNNIKYRDIPVLLKLVSKPIRGLLTKLHAAILVEFPDSKGSRKAHQAWKGGYLDHVREVLNIAVVLYDALSYYREFPFTLEDALIVLFLHDIEKPWKHSGQQFSGVRTKKDWFDFKLGIIQQTGIKLTPVQKNAIRYCEGENDDYKAGERVMNELAAFCHCCDILSARVWFDKGQSKNW